MRAHRSPRDPARYRVEKMSSKEDGDGRFAPAQLRLAGRTRRFGGSTIGIAGRFSRAHFAHDLAADATPASAGRTAGFGDPTAGVAGRSGAGGRRSTGCAGAPSCIGALDARVGALRGRVKFLTNPFLTWLARAAAGNRDVAGSHRDSAGEMLGSAPAPARTTARQDTRGGSVLAQGR